MHLLCLYITFLFLQKNDCGTQFNYVCNCYNTHSSANIFSRSVHCTSYNQVVIEIGESDDRDTSAYHETMVLSVLVLVLMWTRYQTSEF